MNLWEAIQVGNEHTNEIRKPDGLFRMCRVQERFIAAKKHIIIITVGSLIGNVHRIQCHVLTALAR